MDNKRLEHRFAVILCADVVGYSRLMGMDEEGTLSALKAVRNEVVDRDIAEHKGRIVRTMGDGLLVEFGSVVDAVRCALSVQRKMPEFGVAMPPDRRIRFRIGINLGDVISDGDSIYGDGVAVASRMESLAEPDGINVSRAVRDQVRDRLPIAFADLGEHEVKNLARPVRVYRIALDEAPPPVAPAAAAPQAALSPRAPAPPQPAALAALPFQNLGGDAETEFFLDSVCEDLITELARARWFSVVARNTSFTCKGTSADTKEIARDLGVRYLVEGSLRKAGSRIRINCHLAEATSGRHLWADRFDGTLEDSFDLQDRITASVVGSVDPVLREAESERARGKPEADRDIYELCLSALPLAFSETEPDNTEAVRLLDRALLADPRYPPANALAAWCLQQRHLMDWPAAREGDREEAKRLARAAIAAGADDPQSLALASAVRAALARDHDTALAAADRAAALNVNSAFVLSFVAVTRCLSGAYEQAMANAERALQISPFDPLAYHAAFALAWACLLTGRTEDAVAHARRAIEGNPNFAFAYCVLALGCARLGDDKEAREALLRLARVAPSFRIGSLRRVRFTDVAHLLPDLELLQGAGMRA